MNNSASCTRLSIIQFEVLHRTHLSKVKLHKFYHNLDASCNRYHNAPTNSHVLTILDLTTYGAGIFKVLLDALNVYLQPDAFAAIFGLSDVKCLGKRYKDIIPFTTLLARRRILLHWKSANPPRLSLRLTDLSQFIQ